MSDWTKTLRDAGLRTYEMRFCESREAHGEHVWQGDDEPFLCGGVNVWVRGAVEHGEAE